MLCGEPPIWPRPTGNLSVGRAVSTIFPEQISFHVVGGAADDRVQHVLRVAAERMRSRLAALMPAHANLQSTRSFSSDVDSVRVALELLPAAPTDDARGPRGPRGPKKAKRAKGLKWRRERAEAEAEAEGLEDALRLTLDTDESYSLSVGRSGRRVVVRVSGKTFFGVRHGLETLLQLAWWDGAALRLLTDVSLWDEPRFPYRGLMLDTSRNFLPVSALRATVDAMAACKLNVFHWHLSDSHSFPFDSPSVPQMARYGAYSRDRTYSAADVAALAEYALHRGVRVLVEIDAPAHAGNGWQWGEAAGLGPLSLCVNEPYWPSSCGQPPCGQLNPDNEHTYAILSQLYRELFALSRSSDLFHLGSDEVNFECWRQHLPNVSTHEDFLTKWLEFERRALQHLARAAGVPSPDSPRAPTAVVWSSVLTRTLRLDPRAFVVQIWSPSSWSDTNMLLNAKYRVIISHVDAWYLDCGLGDYRRVGAGACSPFHTWQTVYQHAPWRDLDSTSSRTETLGAGTVPGSGFSGTAGVGGVLGGEACLWGERTDALVLESRVWPRAAALAERLWTDPDPATTDGSSMALADGSNDATLLAAHARISAFRERLVAWGVRADAVQPLWCHQNPERCF